ncbi:MAG: TonB-dependent receptor [Candidatus Kapaibacterium sp.]
MFNKIYEVSVKKFLFFLALIILPVLSYSQDELESKPDSIRVYKTPSITVSTSRANKENSPVPYTEITQSDIKESYTNQDLPQLLSSMPSVLTFSENGNFVGYTNLSMRGFDQRRIAVLVNGIPQNDPEDHNFYWINLSDFASTISNIQVQRGAGLSSYGPAAIGGSILLSTVNYASFRGVNISSGIGFQEYGGMNSGTEQIANRFAIEYSSGLTDNYAFYAKLGRINSFGYRDQSWAKLNSYFFSAMRFDGNLTTQINIFGGSQEDGLAYNGLPKSYVGDPDLRRYNYGYFEYEDDGKTFSWAVERRKREIEMFSQPQMELLNDWQISKNLAFKSALFLKIGQGYFDYDGTGWTDAESFRLTPEHGFIDAEDPANPIIRSYVGNKYGGWIPRLEYSYTNGRFLVGSEIRIHRSGHWGKINFAENLPENFDPDFKFYSYNGVRNIFSGFVSNTLDLSSDLTLHTELQLVNHLYAIENEKAGDIYSSYQTIDGNTIGKGDRLFEVSYLFLNPRLGLSYSPAERHRTYVSAAFTSREPRMRNLYAASDSWSGASPLFKFVKVDSVNALYDFNSPLIKPEQMLNFELGWVYSSDFLNLNINTYWMEYFNELVKSGQLDVFGSPVDGNAPKTRHYGIEFMGDATIFNSSSHGTLQIAANFTASRNIIVDYEFTTELDEKIQLKDNEIAGFPDLIANLSLAYSIGNFYSGLHLRFVDDFRTDNFGDLLTTDSRIKTEMGSGYYADNTVDSYTVLNANFAYTFDNIPSVNSLRVHLQVNNITDELYAASGIGREFFPAAGRNFFIGFELGL